MRARVPVKSGIHILSCLQRGTYVYSISRPNQQGWNEKKRRRRPTRVEENNINEKRKEDGAGEGLAWKTRH